MPIYQIPEENLDKLTAQIAKLQKRAAKLHVGDITFTLLDYREVEYMKNGFPRIRRIHNVEINGPAPKIGGWTFVATLEPVEDEEGNRLGNILRNVPATNFSIPEKFRGAGNNCDHCHLDRRRNDTFILASDSNEFKQVGRNCLRDFLGHQSPDAYATMAQLLIDAAALGELAGDDGYDGMGGSRRQERFAAEEFLSLAACAIRTYGFRSNKVAQEFGGQSTSGLINEWLNANAETRKKNFKEPLVINDTDKQQAADVYAWLQELGQRENLNDYLYNLSLLGQGATFTSRNFGLAVSAIPTWAKEQEREINRRKRFADDLNSQFIGTIGERIVFTATVVYTNVYESDFGKSYFYKMKTDEGNILGYFASNNMGWETGAKVALKGTVKKQEDRKGVKTTTVTRCSLFVPKDAEKAIKKLQHAISKGVWGGLNESGVWDDTFYYRNGEYFGLMQDAEKAIQKLIDELKQSGQPQPEAK
jgi:hypothetical protein